MFIKEAAIEEKKMTSNEAEMFYKGQISAYLEMGLAKDEICEKMNIGEFRYDEIANQISSQAEN